MDNRASTRLFLCEPGCGWPAINPISRRNGESQHPLHSARDPLCCFPSTLMPLKPNYSSRHQCPQWRRLRRIEALKPVKVLLGFIFLFFIFLVCNFLITRLWCSRKICFCEMIPTVRMQLLADAIPMSSKYPPVPITDAIICCRAKLDGVRTIFLIQRGGNLDQNYGMGGGEKKFAALAFVLHWFPDLNTSPPHRFWEQQRGI